MEDPGHPQLVERHLVVLHHPAGVCPSEDLAASLQPLHRPLHTRCEVVQRRVELRVPPEGGPGRAQEVQQEEGVDPVQVSGGSVLADVPSPREGVVRGPLRRQVTGPVQGVGG